MKKALFTVGLLCVLGLANTFAAGEPRYVWGVSPLSSLFNKAFCYPNRLGSDIKPVDENYCRCTQGSYYAAVESLNPNVGKQCYEMAAGTERKLSIRAGITPDACFSQPLGTILPKSAELTEFCRTNGLLNTADAERR